jgi:hypothetical protein
MALFLDLREKSGYMVLSEGEGVSQPDSWPSSIKNTSLFNVTTLYIPSFSILQQQ